MSLGGLETLGADLAVQVIITDSADALEAARRLFPSLNAVLANGADTDYSPLSGRKLVLMPTAGRVDAARALGVVVGPIAAELKICPPEADRPEGWSIAMLEAEQVRAWVAAVRETIPIPAQQGAGAAMPGQADASTLPDAPPSQSPAGLEPPPHDAIPLEAYEGDAGRSASPGPKKPRSRPHLRAVDGNLARAPDPDDEPLPQALSDDAIADHIAQQHGENWRYVRPWGAWFQWDGDGWRREETAAIDRLCLETTRACALWPEAAALTPEGKRKVNSRRTAGAVRENLAHDRRCAATIDQWDADPWLLGCPGGVIELQSGKLLEAHRSQHITKRCAVAPEGGKPELWLRFLETVTAGDDSLIAYLQRFAGYSLTGETSEHSLVFLYGTGANGKTVFLQTVAGILGDYAVSAGIETFTEQTTQAHSTEIARLRGARLVVTEETDSTGRWAEGKIKRLTGGGKISAHFMRQDDFEFTPQFKLMIAGNHKPRLRSVDEAIRRRFHLVPFAVTIPTEERDKHLMDKLRAEWPQILGWMLDGCVMWQEASLGLPEAIQVATDRYLEAEDTLGQWIEDCCDRTDSCEAALAYRNYSEWCEKQGERAVSRRSWINALIDRGFDSGRTRSARIVKGLSLKIREPGA